MSAYPPTSTNTQYSPAQNVYVRQTSSGNSDRMSMSPKRIELKFTDSFRERLNFRSRHDSNHLSSVDIDMLEEDLGFPPACDDPPPDFISFGSSLTSDSASNSVDFRVRSRSDAASHSNQPMGTIFFFPNSNKLGDNSVQKNVHVQRANLHGSCSNGLDNIYEDKRLAASVPKIMQPCNLFVDTKLANENIVQRRRRMNHVNLPPLYDAHSFPTCPPMGISRSARCSHSPTNQEFNQFSCVWKGKDKLRPRASSFRQHPRRAILPTHLQRSCDSGLESSFSNFALVVKEDVLKLKTSKILSSNPLSGVSGNLIEYFIRSRPTTNSGIHWMFTAAREHDEKKLNSLVGTDCGDDDIEQNSDCSKPHEKHKNYGVLHMKKHFNFISLLRREKEILSKKLDRICGAERTLQDVSQPKSGQLRARAHMQPNSFKEAPAVRPLSVSVDVNYSSLYQNNDVCPATYHGPDRHEYRRVLPNLYVRLQDHGKTGVSKCRLAPISPTVFVASRCEYPILVDIEDWHATLEGKSQNAVYALFMKAHKCYDLIPTSSKLVVFDTDLPVKKAIFALAYNGVRAAPLWDSKKQKYIGMLTITDFIRVLCKYYQSDSKSEYIMGLEKQKIEEWRKVLNEDHQLRPLVGVDPSENLYQAVKILCETKVHRLPILGNSTGNISYIFTHKRIIKFLHLYIVDLPRPSFMDESPRKLGIGTWENICTINRNTTVIEALKAFLKERVSAIPLVDEEGRIIDIYSKFDVVDLVADQSWNNLDISVFDVLKYRSEFFEGVKKCSEMDSLLTVVDILSRTDVHRIIVVDDMDRVIGVISLSDILRFLIINPPTMEENAVSDVLNDSGSQSAGNIDNAILPNEAGLI